MLSYVIKLTGFQDLNVKLIEIKDKRLLQGIHLCFILSLIQDFTMPFVLIVLKV